MNAVSPPEPATHDCASHASFQPEAVSDLVRPIERAIESVAREFHGLDLRQAQVRRQFIVTVDQSLLSREPWSRIVPTSIREALVARILRTYWCGQRGMLVTEAEALAG